MEQWANALFSFCIIIYYNMLKQTIWLQLSSPSWKKAEKNLPSPGFEPGSPRPRSDDLDRSAMGPDNCVRRQE